MSDINVHKLPSCIASKADTVIVDRRMRTLYDYDCLNIPMTRICGGQIYQEQVANEQRER